MNELDQGPRVRPSALGTMPVSLQPIDNRRQANDVFANGREAGFARGQPLIYAINLFVKRFLGFLSAALRFQYLFVLPFNSAEP
jgi:hypothetical protein